MGLRGQRTLQGNQFEMHPRAGGIYYSTSRGEPQQLVFQNFLDQASIVVAPSKYEESAAVIH